MDGDRAPSTEVLISLGGDVEVVVALPPGLGVPCQRGPQSVVMQDVLPPGLGVKGCISHPLYTILFNVVLLVF